MIIYDNGLVRGHQRAPSDSKEFHEVTKRDALRLLENDLDRLLQTAEPNDRPALQQEMSRFSDLFGRFLQEEGPSIDWNKIQKLPENAVMDYGSLKAPKNEQLPQGGTLIQFEDKLRLLEIAQVPKEHVDDFKSVKTFKFFNTNNIWAKLSAIDRVLNERTLNLEIIINNKTLENGLRVIQLETAVGAAMKCFEGSIGINVPRSRFLPVKKTSDLLLVMSNLYNLKNGSLVMSPQRMFPTTPLVKLGENHFAKVKEFLGRFANIPDIIELDHLTVSGDVTFGRGVSLRGTVIIIANHGDRIDIPAGAILENKIVSGNMRILDH
ncbi:UTP--glucose-1-phosphate uridylyltransferase [Lucilia cuprina]|uniref:UTP--glucose-1-phosphate uridylyltransferase n=1 Tax=Lucilia cuprina TaxID=7375 RepID=UPI001F061AF1|nr:UTP--glucose-1-phosphate uridylyltransferase [Lucilia cuprina]